MSTLSTHRFRIFHLGAAASLVALIILCVAWELVLAPLRPGGSWMVLKVIPLLFRCAACSSATSTPCNGRRC